MRILKGNNSGQALLELAFVVPMLLVFVFGLVDFSRAMFDLAVITNMSGEGSSQASRGTTLANTASALINSNFSDLSMQTKGCVIVTSVTSPAAGSYKISAQVSSAPCNGGMSQVGSCNPRGGVCTGSATLPSQIQLVMDTANTTIYVTEVTYNYAPATPIGSFLHTSNWLPSQLYRAAYY